MSGNVTGRLRDIARHATEGPWAGANSWGELYSARGQFVCDLVYDLAVGDDAERRSKADAEYIATFDPVLVTAMLDLVEEVERLMEFPEYHKLRPLAAALGRVHEVAA